MPFLQRIYQIVWGVPTMLLILSVGVYITWRTRFAQLRLLPAALKQFFGRMVDKREEDHGVSSFQALCTALAATVGTGNLAGVAGAIAIGGPGAIFWMWICGLIGMILKFAEATLALRYRVKSPTGEWVGGPMYMIRQGLPKWLHPLSGIYAFFGVAAAFGVGNATQINTVIAGVTDTLALFGHTLDLEGKLLLGVLLAAMIGAMLLGGAKRIGQAAELLVPFAAGAYLCLGFVVLLLRFSRIDDAFCAIVQGAFHPDAVTGGLVGSVWCVLRTGVSRGIFTNEAGMGTASIAHASAQVRHPVEQGMMGLVEVFADTIVICTITALVILVSDVPIPYGLDAGIRLTIAAFAAVLGNWVSTVIVLCTCLFALATVLGWGLYGIRCAQYLFGDGVWKRFALLQIVTVLLGAVIRADTVWLLAEIVNGLMAIPNLIALWVLTPECILLYKNFLYGGNYENFHQRQPLRSLSHAHVPPPGCGGEAGR